MEAPRTIVVTARVEPPRVFRMSMIDLNAPEVRVPIGKQWSNKIYKCKNAS